MFAYDPADDGDVAANSGDARAGGGLVFTNEIADRLDEN